MEDLFRNLDIYLMFQIIYSNQFKRDFKMVTKYGKELGKIKK